MKKKGSIVCLLILFFVVVAALLTRFSYSDGKETYGNEIDDFSVDVFLPDEDKVKESSSLIKLENESEIIVKVSPTPQKQELEEYTLSEVDVIEVYKGDLALVGKKIKIYEPANFTYYHKQYSSTDYYNLMGINNEYIIFLNPLNYPKELHVKEEEKNSYFLSSSTYGKYNIDSREEIPTIDDYEKVLYRDVKRLDIITDSEKVIENYLEIKTEIINNNKYHVNTMN